MPQFSFQDMTDFLEYAGNLGLIKASTAQSYRVACSKIEDALTADEREDVRKIDVDALFTRYENANRLHVSPSTLREYRRRLGTAIDEFSNWREDPSGYKPKRGTAARGRTVKATDSGTAAKSAQGSEELSSDLKTVAQASAPLLSLPYPLRGDLLAHVQIPRDMTSDEASRLAAFIRTLAIDFKAGA